MGHDLGQYEGMLLMKTWSLIKTCSKCAVEYVGPRCTNPYCPHMHPTPEDLKLQALQRVKEAQTK